MRKFIKGLVALCMLLGAALSSLGVAEVQAANAINLVVDGKAIIFPDAQPFVDTQGRTQVPAKFVGEALGASVEWDGGNECAIFSKDNDILVIYIGKKEYTLNNKKLKMDTEAVVVDGRTFVPIKYIAESFGAKVSWDAATRCATVTSASYVAGGTAVNNNAYEIAGFSIPAGSNLRIEEAQDSTKKQLVMWICINLVESTHKHQQDVTEKILLQKYDKSVVSDIMSFVRNPGAEVQKVFRDKEMDQYIGVTHEIEGTTLVLVYQKGVTPTTVKK